MLIDILVNILIKSNNKILFIRYVISNTINIYLVISSLRSTTYLILQFSKLRKFIICLRVVYYLYRLFNLLSIILLL